MNDKFTYSVIIDEILVDFPIYSFMELLGMFCYGEKFGELLIMNSVLKLKRKVDAPHTTCIDPFGSRVARSVLCTSVLTTSS